jgi:hypothetical protein
MQQEKEDYFLSEPGMRLGSRTVERMLAANFGIEEDRLIAFRGRLDHLRRHGCPSGVNTGKGRAATYGWQQIIELALALSLLDLGLSPEHASAFVRHDRDHIHLVVAGLVRGGQGSDELRAFAERGEWRVGSTMFLLGTSFALAGLTAAERSEPAAATFVEASSLVDWFTETHDVGRSVFLIDVGTKVAALIGLVAVWADLSIDQVISDIENWSDEILEKLLDRLDDIHP